MNTLPQRKTYIDVLRGLVMVIMLLDHVRDYFHNGTVDPLDANTTTPLLYFTRWITHLCAPIFVFLAGVSGWLQLAKYKQKGTARFFMQRGVWFILMEWTVVAFAWTFDPGWHFIPFQVIWAIGSSMLVLGALLYLGLKDKVILVLGLIIMFTHNLLDGMEARPDFQSNFFLDLLHNGRFASYHWMPNRVMVIIYPFLPWTGLMMFGFGMGRLFGHEQSTASRRKLFLVFSSVAIALFVALRLSGVYGDILPWENYGEFGKTIMSFLNVRKYPPSLLYMCITLGIAFLALTFLEGKENKVTAFFAVYGRTAFFFYIVHILTVHFFAMLLYFYHGHTFAQAEELSGKGPFLFTITSEGFGLGGVYLVWASVALLLYPLCKWYDNYKRSHPEKNWLRYL